MRNALKAAALVIVLLLGACSGDDGEPTTDPTPTPTEPDTPRAPRGAEAVACDGSSVDPESLEQLPQRVAALGLETAIEELEATVGASPSSATARVRLGELLLRTAPPRADSAATWFDRALDLHEQGCTLAEADAWAALEGAGLSRLIGGDYAAARPFFERSLTRWPTVRATRYNLACTHCQTGNLDGCATELERVLQPAQPPAFLAARAHPDSHYRELAGRDPDLAPLREDAARFAAIVGDAP